MSSTLGEKDTAIINVLVAAARASGLSRFSGSFPSHYPMHRTGYTTVEFTWVRGRHGVSGEIQIRWNASVNVEEGLLP